MAKKFDSAKDYVLSIRGEIEEADEARLLAIAKEMETTYKYILGGFKPKKGDEDSVEEFRGFLEEMVEAEDGASDAGLSDDESGDDEVFEVDVPAKDVSTYTAEELMEASGDPSVLVALYDGWVAKGVKPPVKPGLEPSDASNNDKFVEWMLVQIKPAEIVEVCSMRNFANPKGCKDGYICDIGAGKCIQKVAGQLVEVYNDMELTGTGDEIAQWRRDLETYKQSLIKRKDGDLDIIIPPCGLIDGQEDKFKGCDNGEYCDIDAGTCKKVKGAGAEATVNGFKIFGTAAAVQNFVERVRARAKANGTVASIVYADNAPTGEAVAYTSGELDKKTVKELKEMASKSGVYIKSKALKDEIVAALVKAGVKKPAPPAPPKIDEPIIAPPAPPKKDEPIIAPPAPPKITKLSKGGPYTASELDKKTVKELKELAGAAKIYLPSKFNKGQIVAELVAKGLRKPDAEEEEEEVIEEPVEEPPIIAPPIIVPPKKEEVIKEPVEEPVAAVYTKDELNRKTVKELRALAGDAKIYVSSKAVKDAIIQALVDGGLKRPGGVKPPVIVAPPIIEPPVIVPPKKEPVIEPPVIVPPKKEEPVEEPSGAYTEKELTAMSVVNLKKLAAEKGVYIPSKYLKGQIVAELLSKGVSRGAGPVKPPVIAEPIIDLPPVIIEDKDKPKKDKEAPPVIIKPPIILPPEEVEEEEKPVKPTIAGIKKLNAGADAARIAALRARMERCAGLVV